MRTVFVRPEDWEGDRLEIEGAVHHHLFRVGRLAAGEELRLADGRGRARSGVVESVDSARAEVRLGPEVAANEPAVKVQLLVAAPKKPRAEWLVEKVTELGVGSVRFVRSERGPRSFGGGAFERFGRIARSAAEQCARARLPQVTGMHEFDEIAGLIEASSRSFVLDPSAGPLRSAGRIGSLSLLIGPEGGWTRRELERFEELGVERAGLGERVLRVETAAIIAVSACVIPD